MGPRTWDCEWELRREMWGSEAQRALKGRGAVGCGAVVWSLDFGYSTEFHLIPVGFGELLLA
jgi:hypothetical protein